MLDIARPEETAVSEDVAGPKVPELERLRLHNLVLQQQVCREQLNVLVLQFLQTAQPKALQDRLNDVTAQINATADRMFAAAHLDARLFQLNVDTGMFVERSKSA